MEIAQYVGYTVITIVVMIGTVFLLTAFVLGVAAMRGRFDD